MSTRSRSYSPDSSDFGNSPIKSTTDFNDNRGRSRTPSPSRSLSPARNESSLFLAVNNLTRNVNEGHLKEIFGVYGEILAVTYPMLPNTGYPTGKAVLEFSSLEALEGALIGMNGGQIDGNVVECFKSKYSTPPVKLNREPRRKVFSNSRGRGHRRGGDYYAPMRRNRSRSPIRRRSFSRSRSPVRRARNSSPRRVSRSPGRRVSRSPNRRLPRSRSPVRRVSRSRSPVRRFSRSRSPVRRYSRSRSPVRRFSRSRSPIRRHPRSPSPRARHPIRKRSPCYTPRRNRSISRSPRFNNARPISRSPRRFSPRRRSPSRSPVPISRMNY